MLLLELAICVETDGRSPLRESALALSLVSFICIVL